MQLAPPCLGTAGRLKAGTAWGRGDDVVIGWGLLCGFRFCTTLCLGSQGKPPEREGAREREREDPENRGSYLMHFIPLQQLQSDKQSCNIISEFFKMRVLAYGMLNFMCQLGEATVS